MFGAHVDAAGGLIEQDHLHLFRQPAAKDCFLLVAARQVHDQLFRARRFNVQRLDMLIGIVCLPGVVDQAASVNMLAPGADIDIVAYGVNRNNPLRFAIFRAQHHPGLNGLGRFTNVDGLAIDIHLTAGDPGAAK